MNKQDIDQSYTSWLIYSDYLEENNQLNLAEQIRFELDYKPTTYPPPYTIGGNSGIGGCSDDCVGGGWGSVGNDGGLANNVGCYSNYPGNDWEIF